MANQMSPTNGQNLALPLEVDQANVAYLAAVGDPVGTPTGADNPAAPRLVQAIKPATATRTSVGDAAADTPVLAANVLRKGATVFNESTAVLYLGLGTTAVSITSYTVQVQPFDYYEVPFWFAGELRGYWASNAGGNARVTELV